MADILNFPGKSVQKNEGGAEQPTNVSVIGPVGSVGQVVHYVGQHPDGYRMSVWAVHAPETGYKAGLLPRTGV